MNLKKRKKKRRSLGRMMYCKKTNETIRKKERKGQDLIFKPLFLLPTKISMH